MTAAVTSAARVDTLTDDEFRERRVRLGAHLQGGASPSEHLLVDFDAWMAVARLIERQTIRVDAADIEGGR